MSAIDTIKSFGKLLMKVRDATLKAELQQVQIKAQGEVLELQEKVGTMQTRITDLEADLRKARESADLRGKLERKDGVYYLKESVEGYHQGPYCPTCYDVEGKLVTIAENPPLFRDLAHFRCNNCKGSF